MTSEPNLRDRAIDAAKQAINALGMWLPPAGREAAVDAVLAVAASDPERDTCLDNPQLTAAIGYPVRCPHCATTVPPTHWTKHLQRHHPEQPEPLRPRAERCPESDCTDENQCWRCDYEESQHASATLAAGYCPHCGRGDAGPTADQYEASQRRAVRIQQLLDEQRDRARKDAAAGRESERQLQQQIDQQATVIDRLRDQCRAMLTVQGRCPACRGESLMLADGGYVTCRRLDCPDPEAATRILDRRPDSCGSCGASPVTYYAPDGHPACADCAPCDCGNEPCSKPDVVAARNAALHQPKETPDA